MYTQIPKQKIDIGIKGNDTTGDPLYDGGNKINTVIDSIYNTFGDYRLMDKNKGVNLMTLHATGYFQNLPSSEYISAIQIGSMHNILTKEKSITVKLPTNAKKGERVKLSNIDGSWFDNPLIIDPQNNGLINGNGLLSINTGNITLTLICTNDDTIARAWKLNIDQTFNSNKISIDHELLITKKLAFKLVKKNLFLAVKLLIHAKDTVTNDKFVTEHLLLLLDNIYFTEYAILSNLDNLLLDIDYSFGSGDDEDFVICTINANLKNALIVNIKSMQEIGIF